MGTDQQSDAGARRHEFVPPDGSRTAANVGPAQQCELRSLDDQHPDASLPQRPGRGSAGDGPDQLCRYQPIGSPSPYGLWGKLGTRAAKEVIDASF